MNAELWARIKEAFSVVVARGPENACDFLKQAYGFDQELVLYVLPLVEEHFRILDMTPALASTQTSESELPRIIAGRYRVLTRLGGGSFGDVYRVLDDAAGGGELALKVLRSSDPVALHYFKREFRSLADFYHHNLVKLRELFVHQDRWMVTMEFVDGVDFLQFHDRQSPRERHAALRSSFLQLGEGLNALHRGQLVHRDVKPSNVLVTSAGRVVLLDFGLVHSFDKDPQSLATFAGTPDYMSPEQAAGAAAAEPSDWYAFGVLLYKVLTKTLPFYGNFIEVLRRKQDEDPIPPIDLAPGVPAQLNDLCLNLLRRDPVNRASYNDVIRLLQPELKVAFPVSRTVPIVGRTEPLRQLTDAMAAAEGRPSLAHVCGSSGIGKTVLLREFIANVSKDPSVLVFAGRCYDGETVPYQPLDDLIDHVSQYFRRLPRERVESFLPRNFAVLVKMFPVLGPFLSSDRQSSVSFGAVELRTRALAALRELLGRLRERHRIVLVIDDLQWGDVDGCVALNDLLSSSDSPAILAVLAYRSEDVAASPSLKALRDGAKQSFSGATTFIDLDHLDVAECRQLAKVLLTEPLKQDTLDHIAEQSGGNPFLIHEIARWINLRGVPYVLSRPFSLADVVHSRVGAVSLKSQHLLELSAAAGQPTELSVLQLAGGIDEPLSARDELVFHRLLRSRTVRGSEEVEIYHDRIRTTILAEMEPAALVRRHRELARALESMGARDPERIAAHYERAHDPHLCARYALIAARHAADILAFHEASRFYKMALATETLDSDGRRMAHRECADALANAGRGSQAADHYIAACDGASIDEQLGWNLRAAEELLYAGHVDRGLEIFGIVLKQVRIREPNQKPQLPVSLLVRRVWLTLRGMRWRERQAHEVPRGVLLRIDTCAAAATGLALIDVTRGAALQTASLLLALRAGEPCRIARALAMEAGYRSTAGVKGGRRAQDLLKRARDLANRTGDARAIGLTNVMMAACAWNAGQWQTCHQLACGAREQLRERHERVTWERDTASIFEVDALRWMGVWSTMKAILPALIEDARNRGDLYAETILQMHAGSCVALADDDPARAQAGLQILEHWSNTGFHIEHLVNLHNQVEIALYLGEGRRALAEVTNRWPELSSSFLLRIQTLNIQMRSLLARAAVAAASTETSGSKRNSLLILAGRETRAIRREGVVWGRATSELIQGSAECLEGRYAESIASFGRAEELFDSCGMLLHCAIARRARGSLIAGETGRQLTTAAEATLRAEGIINPGRYSGVVAPARDCS